MSALIGFQNNQPPKPPPPPPPKKVPGLPEHEQCYRAVRRRVKFFWWYSDVYDLVYETTVIGTYRTSSEDEIKTLVDMLNSVRYVGRLDEYSRLMQFFSRQLP
jgi:hypothetical protein